MTVEKPTICVIGLGYVGLPLAAAFARKGYPVSGFDISTKRIEELSAGHDGTGELTDELLQKSPVTFTTDPAIIKQADVVILAIPTPVDAHNKPDLTLVEKASITVGQNLKKGAIVVYESTVYPGVTEELCGSILEKESGMKCGTDFTLGYSPERINPGDKEHTVEKIVKVVAGQDEKTLNTLAELYGSIVQAGIHKAPSIKVAEMAKAIENAQRDINIAFVNEIALLCQKIGISSKDVFAAAKTKWNFLPFQPGLVGGHCIGVDPYYLVEKAKQLGMETQVINAGREINDEMSSVVANQVLTHTPKNPKILILGLTFKENVPDMRNSKVFDVLSALEKKGATVSVWDPHVSSQDVKVGSLKDGPFDAILLLVPHKEFLALGAQKILDALTPDGVLYDLKGVLDKDTVEKSGRKYLSL